MLLHTCEEEEEGENVLPRNATNARPALGFHVSSYSDIIRSWIQVSFQNQIWQMVKICVSDIDGRLGNNTRLGYRGKDTHIR